MCKDNHPQKNTNLCGKLAANNGVIRLLRAAYNWIEFQKSKKTLI